MTEDVVPPLPNHEGEDAQRPDLPDNAPGPEDDAFPTTLSDRHMRAAELETSGLPHGEIAKAVGVSREQFWRWRQRPDYKAYRARLRLGQHQAMVNRLWALGNKALDVAEELVDEGDPQTAMQIIRLLGPGLTDLVFLSEEAAPALPANRPAAIEPPRREGVPELAGGDVPDRGQSIGCPECGKPARSEGGLKRHMKARHRPSDEPR